jgi:dethiobiotin synthetase 2
LGISSSAVQYLGILAVDELITQDAQQYLCSYLAKRFPKTKFLLMEKSIFSVDFHAWSNNFL